MDTPPKIVIAIACLSLLAAAQEKTDEPDYAKAPAPLSSEAVAAREAGLKTALNHALNAAQQLSASQGFRQRDARWVAPLADEGFTIVPLQFFASNEYYLIVGTDADSDEIAAAAFDPDRLLVKTSPARGNGKLIFHITPKKSGRHYLRLHRKNPTAKPSHCAVTYVYR